MQHDSPSSAVLGDGFASTAGYWTRQAVAIREGRQHWERHPLVQAAQDGHRGGVGLIDGLASTLGKHVHAAVGLGVGEATAEIELLRLGVVDEFDLYDVTPALLDAAEQKASSLGLSGRVRCHVADINQVRLEPDSCELVTFFSSLHHVDRLETVLEGCYGALRPGGLFFAAEYIGPDRFAFPAEHLELARAIYRTLDPALRCPCPELPFPDPQAVAEADPTESIHSSEIVHAVERRFPSVRLLSHEACLTIILWYGLNHDALYESDAGTELVRWLLEVDRALIRSGRLPTYQAELTAWK